MLCAKVKVLQCPLICSSLQGPDLSGNGDRKRASLSIAKSQRSGKGGKFRTPESTPGDILTNEAKRSSFTFISTMEINLALAEISRQLVAAGPQNGDETRRKKIK